MQKIYSSTLSSSCGCAKGGNARLKLTDDAIMQAKEISGKVTVKSRGQHLLERVDFVVLRNER